MLSHVGVVANAIALPSRPGRYPQPSRTIRTTGRVRETAIFRNVRAGRVWRQRVESRKLRGEDIYSIRWARIGALASIAYLGCATRAFGQSATPISAAAAPANLTLAQLRADPTGAHGKSVAWDVEVYALQTADGLRGGLAPNEEYLLVSGPGQENATLYVTFPPDLQQRVRSLTSVAPVRAHLVATVRVGRSDPLGVPILDAVALTRK